MDPLTMYALIGGAILLLVFFLFVGITLALGYTGQSPFIYFQF